MPNWINTTVLTMRYQHGDFVMAGLDIEPVKFKTRREAWVWCLRHHPGSPVKLVAANAPRRRHGRQNQRQVGAA